MTHDVVRYVIQHPEVLKILPYIIELVHTTLERWKVPADKNNPPAVIVVDDKSLKMPASPNSQKKFGKLLSGESVTQNKATRKAKSKSKGRRKKSQDHRRKSRK